VIGHSAAGPVAPEAGTEYVVRVEALDGDGAVISTLTEVNVADALTYTWVEVLAPPATVTGRISVAALRDGVESWQRASIEVRLSIGARAFEEADENRLAEDGEEQIRIIEG
jgi:hypothetical protein